MIFCSWVMISVLPKRRGRALRTPTTPRPASASASAMTPTVRLSLNYCICCVRGARLGSVFGYRSGGLGCSLPLAWRLACLGASNALFARSDHELRSRPDLSRGPLAVAWRDRSRQWPHSLWAHDGVPLRRHPAGVGDLAGVRTAFRRRSFEVAQLNEAVAKARAGTSGRP